jgi:hypothetical protein
VTVGEKLASVKLRAAQAISDGFFLDHPEWIVRYGDRGRQHCTADPCFHLEFLAGAIEVGSPEAFADYARLTARMLAARGIAAHALEENLRQLEKHLALLLLPEEQEAVLAFYRETGKLAGKPNPSPARGPPKIRWGSRDRSILPRFLAVNERPRLTWSKKRCGPVTATWIST